LLTTIPARDAIGRALIPLLPRTFISDSSVCVHSKELLLLALNFDDLPHSIKAFDFITATNERVLEV
jgi:hypothetical protein